MVIPWNEFEQILNRGLNFYSLLRDLIKEYLVGYKDPVDYYGTIGDDGHNCWWRIEIDSETGGLTIRSTSP